MIESSVSPIAMTSNPFTTSAPTEQDPALVHFALSLPILIEKFDAKRQNEFSRGIALTAGVQKSEVEISCIRDVQRVDRRGLPTRGIHVDVIIEAQNMQSATIMVSKLTESSIDVAMQDSGFAGVKIVRNATAILRHVRNSSTLAVQEDFNERSQTTPTPIDNSSHSDDLIDRGLLTIVGIVVVSTFCCCSACLECFRRFFWNKVPVASNKRNEIPLLPVKPNLDRTGSSRLCLSRVVFDQESPEQTHHHPPIVATPSFISRYPLEQHQAGSLQKAKRLSADLGLMGPGAPGNTTSDFVVRFEVIMFDCRARKMQLEDCILQFVNLTCEPGATFQSPSTVISASSLTNDSEYSMSSSLRRDRECWAAEEDDDDEEEESRGHSEQRANIVTEVVVENAIGTHTICCSM